MFRLFYKFIVASLTIMVFVLGMNTNVSATMMYYEYDGNIKRASFAVLLDLIGDCCDIRAEDWSKNVFIDTPPEFDSDTLTIEDAGKLIAFKAGNQSYLYCNPDIGSTVTITAPNGKGISNYASIPDASIMLLLGPILLFIAVLGRRRKRFKLER